MSRSSVKIAPGAVVCSECELKGDITIGSRTIIHPKVRIIAEAGPILIGESNLIEEQAEIINRSDSVESGGTQRVMIIGNHNVFEVGSRIFAKICARVGRDTELSNGCIIGAMCDVTSCEVMTENTVIYGSQYNRRVQQERPPPQTLQLDFLTKILPNYHHLKKPTKVPQQATK